MIKDTDRIIMEALFERFESLQFGKHSGEKSMGLPNLENMNKEERFVIYYKWRDGYQLLRLMETMVKKAKDSLNWFDGSIFKENKRIDNKEIWEQVRPVKTLLPALKKNVTYYEKKLNSYQKKWDKEVQTIVPLELIKKRDDLFKVLKKKIKSECLGKSKFEFEYDSGTFRFRCKFQFKDRIAHFGQGYEWDKDYGEWKDMSKYGWGRTLTIGRKELYGQTAQEWGEKAIEYITTHEDLKSCLKANLRKKAEASLNKAKEDLKEMKALASRVNMHLDSAKIKDGKAELVFEKRYPLSWEYDRDDYTQKEWYAEGDKYIQSDLKKLIKVFPKKTYVVQSGGIGEKGHTSFYVSKK